MSNALLSADLLPLSVIVILCATVLWFVYSKVGAVKCDLPGPKRLPFFGNLLEVQTNTHRLLDWAVSQVKAHGLSFCITFPLTPPMILTADPALVEHILSKRFDNYVKGPFFKSIFQEFLGDGIFNVDGHQWFFQRKTASLMFSQRRFRDFMGDVFLEHGKKVIHHLAVAAETRTARNMQDMFARYTLDSIGEIGFGVQLNCLDEEDVPFARAFDHTQFVAEKRFYNPFWKVTRFFDKGEREMVHSLQTLNKFAHDVIEARRQESAEALASRTDFLTLFMNERDEAGQPFSDRFLRDVIMNFMIAGRDTTAQALSWATYALCLHPNVQRKAQAEIDTMLHGELPSYDVLKNMKYLQAVVDETLRLYPSVPKDAKFAAEDDVLPNGWAVPKGAMIVYAPFLMGRQESLWPNASVFDPDRWLTDEPRPSPFKFVSFQAGPRICLGQNMAYLEAKTMLAMILQRFNMTLEPGQTIGYVESVTLPQLHGVRIIFEPRQ